MKPVKKIAFFIESDFSGGAERVLRTLVSNLDKAKYDITVICFFKNYGYGNSSPFSDAFQCRNRILFDNTGYMGSKLLYPVASYLINKYPDFVYNVFVHERFDTIIAFYEGMPTSFVAKLKSVKAKKVAWLHYGDGFRDINELDKQRYINQYSSFNEIVGVSKGVCDNFRNRVSSLLNPMVRYNLIDDEAIRKKMLSFTVENKENYPLFVAVGRICKVKGFERLLSVCKMLIDDGHVFHLYIIGDGDENILRKQANDLRISKYISFLGYQDNPLPYIKSASWLICSSYAEGFSTVIVESFILGTPVISTDCSGTEELLGDSAYGIRCENSEKGLYDAMKWILNNPELRNYYAEKAVEKGGSFNKQELLARIEEIL